MTLCRHKRAVKCDQKVNITAAFGTDLALEGVTAIPNILLRVYRKIGITDFQMMLLIQLFRFYTEEGELCPSPEEIAGYMQSDPATIKRELKELLEKEIISESQYFDPLKNEVFVGYDFEPLFLKVSDVWASIRAKEIEESEKLLTAIKKRVGGIAHFDEKTSNLIPVFEQEFGRALSPFEIEQIEQWAQEIDPLLIVEALRRAVLLGKYNLKYINGILLEWRKNNLQTIEAVEEYDRNFRQRRTAAKKNVQGNDKKKEFIKSLYV